MRPAFPRTDRQHEAGQGSSIDLLKAGKKRFLPSRASAFLRVQWVGWLPASGARANFQAPSNPLFLLFSSLRGPWLTRGALPGGRGSRPAWPRLGFLPKGAQGGRLPCSLPRPPPALLAPHTTPRARCAESVTPMLPGRPASSCAPQSPSPWGSLGLHFLPTARFLSVFLEEKDGRDVTTHALAPR